MCTIFIFCLLKGVFEIQIMSALLELNRRNSTNSTRCSLTTFIIKVPLPHWAYPPTHRCAHCLMFPFVLEFICISPPQIIFPCGYKPQAAPNSFNATSNPERGSSFSSLLKQTLKKAIYNSSCLKNRFWVDGSNKKNYSEIFHTCTELSLYQPPKLIFTAS